MKFLSCTEIKHIFLCFISLATCACAEITSIKEFKEAKIESLTAKSLVIFDVDEVLVTPEDILLKDTKSTFDPGFHTLTKEQYEEVLSIMLSGTHFVLVDPSAPQFIKSLSSKGIPIMGFTSCRTGSFGVVSSMQEWRVHQLNHVGIDLNTHFSQEHIFSDLVASKKHPPLFKKGILFCGDFYFPHRSTKGELFSIFLDRMKLTPDTIVFFDDSRKNLDAVEAIAKERGIPFKGYHFQTASEHKLDEKIAEVQFQTALKQKKWLSDKEAKAALKDFQKE